MSAMKRFFEAVSENLDRGGELTLDVELVGQYLLVRGLSPQAATLDLLDHVKDLSEEEIDDPEVVVVFE